MGTIRLRGGFIGLGSRNKAIVAGLAGALAVVPMALITEGSTAVSTLAAGEQRATMGLADGHQAGPVVLAVDGSLPEPPNPADLATVELPPSSGQLGIPATALKAYRNAARQVGAEIPGCNVDWALLASIGRIESNHARGGYLDAKGNTLEPILGPVLNGVGPVAAIADTDNGRYDADTTWDRAVGPTQFIPLTWERYGADGNGDGEVDPNNIYDATVASARYLCSGGVDLAKDDQLRAALYRYNNSASYVETVIRWATAYRNGVSSVPDSDVPLAVPHAPTVEAPSPPAQVSAAGGGRGKTPSPTPTSPEDTTSPTDSTSPTGGSSSPTDPGGSTDPTDPTDPTDTTDPTGPTDPTDPTDSTDPTDPTTEPTPDPTDPTEPTEPTEPTKDPEDCDTETTTPPDGSSTTTSPGATTSEDATDATSCEADEPTDPAEAGTSG